MTDPDNGSTRRPRPRMALAAAALLAVGGAIGAGAVATTRPAAVMAPATPIAIRSLSSGGIVTIRGRVAEVYGNKFILADATGRTLVDTGRGGEGGAGIAAGQTVTVQGRFDGGFVHAGFLVDAAGTVRALEPAGGPPPHGRHGPPHGGPGRPDGPPPPPPSDGGAAPDAPEGPPPAAPAPVAR